MNDSVDTEQAGLNLERALSVVRRRALPIALCAVLVAASAYGFSRQQAKRYAATASLVFDNNQLSQQVAGLPTTSAGNQQAQQNTNVKLVQLGDMAATTAGQLGRGLTEATIRGSLSVGAQGESNIVDVSATAATPALAAAIANTYTRQFVAEQQNSNHAYYASALALVDRQLAALSARERLSTAGVALQNRAQSLGVLAELRSGNVQVAQAATPPSTPSSPETGRNTLLGLLVGLLLGVGGAFLLERLDRRIREPRDLEQIYGLPLLGVVPESAALSPAARRDGDGRAALPPAEEEAFHLIRAHLRYFNVDRDLRTLLVVSAAPGDGKTMLARQLAAAAAQMGSRVLLVEADLRRPTLARQLGAGAGPGLADVLIGAVELGAATQAIDLAAEQNSRRRVLDVLVAGAVLPPNPAELIESQAMASLLDRARGAYDLIVIDTPPLTAVSDAFPLLREVDGVVIVGRLGRNRRDVAERLRETLAGTGAPLLGVVANGAKVRGADSYAYAEAYTANGAAAARKSTSTVSG